MDLSEQLSSTYTGGDTDEEPRSLAGALNLSDHLIGKSTKAEANYIDKGPLPFTCGNCKYIVWGNKSNGADLCQLVSGDVRPDAACRLFCAKPDYRQQEGHEGVHLTIVQPSTVGTYSDNPPVDHLRKTRLKPARLLWRRDRFGWSETGEPRSE